MATYEAVTPEEEAILAQALADGEQLPAGYAYNPGWYPVKFKKVVDGGGTTTYGPVDTLLDARIDALEDGIADEVADAAATAATAAVDDAFLTRDILEAGDIVEDDPVFAVVDEDGRRTWIEAAADGGLTDHAVDKIGEHISGAVEADMTPDGLSFAVVDEDDARTDLELDTGGHITDRVLALWGDRLGVTGVAASSYLDSTGAAFPVSSGPDIVCWGDSMTNGTGGGGTTYPAVLATLTGHTVHNRGVGGETSVTIAARAGATPMLVIPSGGSIPASGSVALALQPINGETPAPLLQIGNGSIPYSTGTLAGIPGTISYDSGTTTYTFTRTTAGTAVTVDRPTPWLDSESPDRRGDIACIWIGQNGPSHDRAKADVAAIVRHLTALDKRYLVISKPQSTDAEDAEWHDLYGRRFIAIRQYMVAYGLDDAGITPTAQDETDIANGVVPDSLRYDIVHWTAAGYTILAEQVDARLRELGWI